eukprot:3004123-Pleurochrysis_carterae.AAC.1
MEYNCELFNGLPQRMELCSGGFNRSSRCLPRFSNLQFMLPSSQPLVEVISQYAILLLTCRQRTMSRLT